MITAWRLVRRDREHIAFSGEGSRRFGGRWNHRGHDAVYTSEHQSLTILETFVHLAPEDIELGFSIFRIEIPAGVKVETVEIKGLPKNWREMPYSKSARDLGTKWIAGKRTVALKVPSVIVPDEYNYVLNPDHPDFRKLRMGKPKAYSFDVRMLNRRK